ncbi:MAG: endonuclease/exonuclease/phosphatase family protein [Alistipes sp.]|nr:endonuclease/exonuclease/phosphatase family protein [Candidatus Alistipes equi]
MNRKVLLFIVAILLPCTLLSAELRFNAESLSNFTIVYEQSAEDEVGIEAANHLKKFLKKEYDINVPVIKDSEIVIGPKFLLKSLSLGNSRKKEQNDTFDYSINIRSKEITIYAGGCWAMDYAIDRLKELFAQSKTKEKGNIYGKFIFPRFNGTNLRILDDNIWQYDKAESPTNWKAMGIECTSKHRSRYLAELVYAFEPDIVALQEYSSHMDAILRPLLQDRGYKIAFPFNHKPFNFTPIFFNSKTVKLIESKYVPHTPSQYNNHGTKSFTLGVFTLSNNDKKFIVVGTHLWWKSEKSQQGSDDARTQQVRAIIKEVDKVLEKYNVPVFVMGDMNCTITSEAMKQFLDAGYAPAWDVATEFGDKRSGHHVCSPKDGFSRRQNRKDDGKGQIDHFFIYNAHRAKIRIFKRIQAFFTVPITDHYPNYADIDL